MDTFCFHLRETFVEKLIVEENKYIHMQKKIESTSTQYIVDVSLALSALRNCYESISNVKVWIVQGALAPS